MGLNMLASLKNKNSLNLSVVESISLKDLSTARLSSLLEVISKYRVLLLGDGIIDEYVYVRPQGKSPKENIISNKIINSERFRGGVWAAGSHIEGFVANCEVIAGRKTTLKRRDVEQGYIRKLFETHEEGRSEAQK